MESNIDPALIERCMSKKLVDERGIVVKPVRYFPSASFVSNTVYDWFEFGDDQAVHMVYTELVDELVRKRTPIHLGEAAWTRRFIGATIRPGSFVALNRATYFKRIEETEENAIINARIFKRRIEVKYSMNTRDMFGATSITCSFSGHKSCTAIVLIKSIDAVEGKMVLSCTPIALGVGFQN